MTSTERVRSVRNQFLLEEGDRLVRSLNDARVPALVIKGPRLSERLFGCAGRREHADIDLLVKPPNASQAMEAVAARGYHCEVMDPDSPLLRAPCENALRKGGPVPVLVEVHWRLYPRHLPFPRRLELDVLWPRFEAQGMDFDDDDLALYLCFHWVKEWEGLEQLELFAAALGRCGTFPWEALVREAEYEGTMRMLLLGALMAHRRFRVDVPAWVIGRAEHDGHVMKDASRVMAAFSQDAKPESAWGLFRFAWDLLMNWKDRARFVRYMLITPTLAEFRAWPVPPQWRWAYYLFRPVRLAWRHISQSASSS